jgi:hypothetical protein
MSGLDAGALGKIAVKVSDTVERDGFAFANLLRE